MTTTYSLYTENPLILLILTETMTRESGEGETEDGVSWNSFPESAGLHGTATKQASPSYPLPIKTQGQFSLLLICPVTYEAFLLSLFGCSLYANKQGLNF